MKELEMNQKQDSKDGVETNFRKKAVAVGLKVFYSGVIMLALFPTIYGADWPERGWC
ncbi:hypothetical protein [Paenibacillus sp. LjRoot56]|uniref:hypothetical protein n=1 Tax=Paenibacillus sp. LjRoot56 TaxID=3342333 RepID=UPI003ED0AA7E